MSKFRLMTSNLDILFSHLKISTCIYGNLWNFRQHFIYENFDYKLSKLYLFDMSGRFLLVERLPNDSPGSGGDFLANCNDKK